MLLLVVLVAGGYLWFNAQQDAPQTTVVIPEQVAPPSAPPAEIEPLSIPAAETHARALLESLSAELSSRLPGDFLGRIVAAVQLASENQSYLHLFSSLRPAQPFEVEARGGRTFIAKSSYDRYDELTDFIEKVDARKLADAYRTLKPPISQLFAEVAPPGASFDAALAAALKPVADAQITDEPVELSPKGLVWAFKDSEKESMGATQKLLVRVGPGNAKRLQTFVRAFVTAAELPGR